MLGGLISGLIGAVAEALKLINTKESVKMIRELTEAKLELLKEEEKGYDSDDPKCEQLYKRIKILADAAQQEIALHAAKAG